MKAVHKYHLPTDKNDIQLPTNSKVLSVGEQGGEIMMWVLVDTFSSLHEMRKFLVYGTGREITEPNLTFIGTVHLAGGALIYHVFEK